MCEKAVAAWWVRWTGWADGLPPVGPGGGVRSLIDFWRGVVSKYENHARRAHFCSADPGRCGTHSRAKEGGVTLRRWCHRGEVEWRGPVI